MLIHICLSPPSRPLVAGVDTCVMVSVLTPEDWSYTACVTALPSLNHLRDVSLFVFVTCIWRDIPHLKQKCKGHPLKLQYELVKCIYSYKHNPVC